MFVSPITTPIAPGPLNNGKAIGVSIENVSYAIKATYLINMYKMLPNIPDLNTKSSLLGHELKDQVKILKDYVCLIKIY